MGIHEGMRAIFKGASKEVLREMELPALNNNSKLSGKFDLIHLFVLTQDQFHQQFPLLKSRLDRKGMLWISWPKARQLDTDLTLPIIIKLGYDYGLVESTTLSINSVWSAIKFTHPKTGKVYKNSYGKLRL